MQSLLFFFFLTLVGRSLWRSRIKTVSIHSCPGRSSLITLHFNFVCCGRCLFLFVLFISSLIDALVQWLHFLFYPLLFLYLLLRPSFFSPPPLILITFTLYISPCETATIPSTGSLGLGKSKQCSRTIDVRIHVRSKTSTNWIQHMRITFYLYI